MEPHQKNPPPQAPFLNYESITKPTRSRTNRLLIIFAAFVCGFAVVFSILILTSRFYQTTRTRQASAKTEIANLEAAIDRFEVDAGRYPTNAESFSVLLANPANLQTWYGPYIKQINPDPWGKRYIYLYPGIHNVNGYDLSSAGPDGKPNTPDDMGNW